MLLGLAGSLLKTLGKKKSKKNGKQVADSITNQPKNEVDKSQNPTTVHESGADLKPLEDVRDDIQASSKKKKDPLNLALDGIDNALFGIIDTLTETNILRKKIKSDAAKAQLDKKKSLREKVLESGLVKGAVGSVKKSVGNAWDKMMQFLTWTLMGAIVNAIVKNWDEIQKEIQKLVDDLKDLWDSPILKIFREFAMWIMVKGFQLTKLILPKDIDKMKEDTDKLKKELGVVEDQYKDIDKKIKNSSNNESSKGELTEKDREDIEKNNISSYSLGIEEYSDLSEVFGTTNIFLSDDTNTSSNNASSSGSLFYSSATSGIDIKDMQNLAINTK